MPRVLNLGSITALPSGKQITPNEKIGFSVVWRYLLQRPACRLPLPRALHGETSGVPSCILVREKCPRMERDALVFAGCKLNMCPLSKQNKETHTRTEKPNQHAQDMSADSRENWEHEEGKRKHNFTGQSNFCYFGVLSFQRVLLCTRVRAHTHVLSPPFLPVTPPCTCSVPASPHIFILPLRSRDQPCCLVHVHMAKHG